MNYKAYLTENVIPFWLKNGIDRELGGIYLYLDEKGKLYGDEKGAWFQGRALYTLSRAYNTIEKNPEYLEAAGLICLPKLPAAETSGILQCLKMCHIRENLRIRRRAGL